MSKRRPWPLFFVLLVISVAGAPAEEDRSLAERCEAEIVELHRFLEEWSNAELPPSDEAFSRFADVLDESFLLIDPDGTVIDRPPIVDAIRRAHGRWREAPGTVRIENFRFHHASGTLALASYEEWHDLPGGGNGRLSSVLFGEDASAPNGLVWLHLHEVWIHTEPVGE